MGFFSSDSSQLAIQNTATSSGTGQSTTGGYSPTLEGKGNVGFANASVLATGKASNSTSGVGNNTNSGTVNTLNLDNSNKIGNIGNGSNVTVTDNGATRAALDALSNALAHQNSLLADQASRLATGGGTTIVGAPQPTPPPVSSADAKTADNSNYFKLAAALAAGVALWFIFGKKN